MPLQLTYDILQSAIQRADGDYLTIKLENTTIHLPVTLAQKWLIDLL